MCFYLLGHSRFIIVVPRRHFCPAEMDQEGKVGSVYCGMMEEERGEGVLEIIRGAERGNCGRREEGLSCMIKARLEFARFGEEPDDLFETRSLR